MELKLPLSVVGPAEVSRLIREITSLEDYFIQAEASRGQGVNPPRITRMLEELVNQNKANLLEHKVRDELKAALKNLLEKAPTVHLSFAADPPPKALERILIWLRENIHPALLVRVGLQPNIAAGCVLRTANKIFDMSLRARFAGQEGYLLKLIDGAVNESR